MKKQTFLFSVTFSLLCLSLPVAASAHHGSMHHEERHHFVQECGTAITTVQINTIKLDAESFGTEELETLLANIGTACTHPDEHHTLPDDPNSYVTICLHYSDGTKALYCFFYEENGWYMQTPDGTVCSGADFIMDVADFSVYENGTVGEYSVDLGSSPVSENESDTESSAASESDPESENNTASEDSLTVGSYITIEDDARLSELLGKFDTYDLSYYFIRRMLQQTDSGVAEEDALDCVRQSLTNGYMQYQYALEQGYSCTEEELRSTMDDSLRYITEAENYEKVEELFREAGTSLQESIEKSEASLRAQLTIQKMYNAKCQEFRCGNDTIDGHICDTVSDYWNAFLQNVIYSEIENADLGEWNAKLDEAERAYHAYVEE